MTESLFTAVLFTRHITAGSHETITRHTNSQTTQCEEKASIGDIHGRDIQVIRLGTEHNSGEYATGSDRRKETASKNRWAM